MPVLSKNAAAWSIFHQILIMVKQNIQTQMEVRK